jgi:hypothetical protein
LGGGRGWSVVYLLLKGWHTVNRELFYTLQATDQLLSEAYKSAKRQQLWSVAANVQAARARVTSAWAPYADAYAGPEDGQLSLVDSPVGRAHDSDPAA